MYASDYDDMLCQTSWESSATPQTFNPVGKYQIHWTYLMQPYIKNWDIFRCGSDADPVKPKYACPNGAADLGKLDASGQMYCDWQAPVYSMIPDYNAMPAHDWAPVSMTSFDEPANQILVTDRRNKLTKGALIGPHKGLSGFNPSQPCPGSTYAKITVDQAISHLANDTSDKFDIVRVQWDRHSGSANYAYADGHAKNQKLGQTLDPERYQYGSRWLPGTMPWNSCN